MRVIAQKNIGNIIFTLEDMTLGKYLGGRVQLLPKIDVFWTNNGSFGIDFGWLTLRFYVVVVDIDDIDNDENQLISNIDESDNN